MVTQCAEKIKTWYYKMYKSPYTVACDYSPFWGIHNQREVLFHVFGLKKARKTANSWAARHTSGQARILIGHVSYDNKSL